MNYNKIKDKIKEVEDLQTYKEQLDSIIKEKSYECDKTKKIILIKQCSSKRELHIPIRVRFSDAIIKLFIENYIKIIDGEIKYLENEIKKMIK